MSTLIDSVSCILEGAKDTVQMDILIQRAEVADVSRNFAKHFADVTKEDLESLSIAVRELEKTFLSAKEYAELFASDESKENWPAAIIAKKFRKSLIDLHGALGYLEKARSVIQALDSHDTSVAIVKITDSFNELDKLEQSK